MKQFSFILPDAKITESSVQKETEASDDKIIE